MTEWIVTSSALILIVIALRGLLKGKISLKLQYGLWALVLIRLLIPFSIVDSALSVVNILDEFRSQPVIQKADDAVADYESAYQNVVQRYESSGTDYSDLNIREEVQQELYDRTYEKIEYEYAQTGTVVPEIQIQTEAQQQVEVISLTAVISEAIPHLWIGGMVILAVVLIVSNLHFAWKLYKSRNALDIPGVPLKVYLTDYVATPCLFGVGQSDIYLTQEVMTDSKMRGHVLAHEMSHYRQGDHIWSVLRCLCLVLHWYNPLVWVAAVLSKQDAELACDEATIHVLGETERVAYGRTLIGMTCIRRDPNSLMLAATTMLGTKKTLKDRIALIAKKPKTALFTLIACILVAAIAVGCTFTGASPKSEEELLLDRCREAVAYIQNLEHFEITEHYETIEESDYVVGPFSEEVRYVHSGDNWYHFRSTADWTWRFLEKDGEQYRKDITNAVPEEDIPAIEWKAEDLSQNLSAKHAWIMDIHWNDETIEYLTYTGNGDGYEGGAFTPLSVSSDKVGSVELITIELEFGAEQTFNDIEQGSVWILTFRFDLYSGDVTEVKREIVMEDRKMNANGETVKADFRSTSTLSIYPGTEEEMSAIIDDIYNYEILTTVPGPEGPTLNLSDLPVNSGASEEYYSFCYDPDRYYLWLGEDVAEKIKNLTPGYVYSLDYETEELICVLDEPVIGLNTTSTYIFCITAENIIKVTDLTGEMKMWLYAAEEPLAPESLGYNRQSLYFVEGDKIMNMDLATGEIKMLFEYEGAIDADPLYGIDNEFPHLLCIKTATDDVACNLRTGETAIIPKTGQWGTEAFELYMGYGIWPVKATPTKESIQNLFSSDNGNWYWRAIGCTFEKPEDISLYYLFYNGLPSDERQDRNTYSQSEVAFLKDLARNSTWKDESVWVNAHKMPRQYISDVLAEYFGLTLNDVTIPEEWSYLAETDSYYYIRSDSYSVAGQIVTDVQTSDDGLVYVFWTTSGYVADTRNEDEIRFLDKPNMLTVLQAKADGSYLVLSNMPYGPQNNSLSNAELAEFSDLLAWSGDNETDETIWYNYAIKSIYEEVADIDLFELFYSAPTEDLTQDDITYLKSIGENPDTDPMVHKYSISMMNDVLQRYFGTTLDQCDGVGLDKLIYNPDGECYYHSHGDFLAGYPTVTGGEQLEDGSIQIHYTNSLLVPGETVAVTITLIPTDGGYQIVSNVLDTQ